MIPKIIHYCWFGRSPLPAKANECILSWKKFFPDYKIKEWNEDNFDVNIIPYTREAYQAKKYAFVSDYARYWILYNYGGLYFDTDVEVIKPFDDILIRGSFMGVEVPAVNGIGPLINPGLGLGVEPGLHIFKTLLDTYTNLSFINEDGSYNQKTIVAYTSEVLGKNGLKATNSIQQVEGIWIYPKDFFNPLDSLTGRIYITDNTHSIHRYMNSWSDSTLIRRWMSRTSHRLFGLWFHKLRGYKQK